MECCSSSSSLSSFGPLQSLWSSGFSWQWLADISISVSLQQWTAWGRRIIYYEYNCDRKGKFNRSVNK